MDNGDSNIGRRRAAARTEGRESYVKRRAEVLVAAANVFRERGYHATSMTEVAEVLNTDRATLYYYIGSKDELFQEVVRSALQANAKVADEIVESGGSPRDRLSRLIEALMVSYESNHPYLFVYVQENLSSVGAGASDWANEMSAYSTRFARAVARVIHQGVDDGSFRDVGDVAVATSAILGMVNWSHRWFEPGKGAPAAQVGAIMSGLALHGILTSP